MPLSKKRNRDRMKELRLHNKEVQPDKAKIAELRDMMQDISGVRGGLMMGNYIEDRLDEEDWPEIDADGHIIPDF